MATKSLKQIANYKRLSLCGMEELAAHQGTIPPSGGILFARNTDGDEKRAARQQIVDLFHPNKWDKSLNMLTMPGVSWRFERMVLGMREPGWLKRSSPYRTHFTAIENDRAIYFAGVTQMPGIETPDRLIKPVKRERFPFAELAVKTRYASYFFANVDDVMAHEWVTPSYGQPTKVGWDAAWLDYTGPMSIERLAKIQQFYDKYVRDVLILTVLAARWNRLTSDAIKNAGGHSEWLRLHLDGHVLHDLEYLDTSPMAQFAVSKLTAAASVPLKSRGSASATSSLPLASPKVKPLDTSPAGSSEAKS